MVAKILAKDRKDGLKSEMEKDKSGPFTEEPRGSELGEAKSGGTQSDPENNLHFCLLSFVLLSY